MKCSINLDIITGILALLCSVGSAVIFILSATQLDDVTKLDNGQSIQVNDHNPCRDSDYEFYDYRPWRASYGTDEYFVCAWNPTNSGFRMALTLLALFFPVLWLIGLIKSKKVLLWIFAVAAALFGVGLFIIMIVDSNSVRESSEWCNDGMPPYDWDKDITDCDYSPFITICVLDFFVAAFWMATSAVAIRSLWIKRNATPK